MHFLLPMSWIGEQNCIQKVRKENLKHGGALSLQRSRKLLWQSNKYRSNLTFHWIEQAELVTFPSLFIDFCACRTIVAVALNLLPSPPFKMSSSTATWRQKVNESQFHIKVTTETSRQNHKSVWRIAPAYENFIQLYHTHFLHAYRNEYESVSFKYVEIIPVTTCCFLRNLNADSECEVLEATTQNHLEIFSRPVKLGRFVFLVANWVWNMWILVGWCLRKKTFCICL